MWLLVTIGKGEGAAWWASRMTMSCYNNRKGRVEMAAALMLPGSRDWTLHILEPEKGDSNLEKSVNSGNSTPASKKKGGGAEFTCRTLTNFWPQPTFS